MKRIKKREMRPMIFHMSIVSNTLYLISNNAGWLLWLWVGRAQNKYVEEI